MPAQSGAVDLTERQARRLRQRGQWLVGTSRGRGGGQGQVAAVATALCGLQAQYVAAAALAVRARSSGLLAGDVEAARVERRAVVLTWCQRGTLHLLGADDLAWLLPLIGPIFARVSRRRERLGLDAATLSRGEAALRDVLGGQGPLTRAAIVSRLRSRGLDLNGQAVPHLLAYAAHRGTICYGPGEEAKPTYVLLRDWLPGWGDGPRGLPRERALAELARRYLDAYGPATPQDLAAWSGLPLSEARAAWRAIAADVLAVRVAGLEAWLSRSRGAWLEGAARPAAPTAPAVRLVAGYDPYLLGYRHRDLAVPAPHARRVHPGGGLLHPTLLVDGLAAGTWRSNAQGQRLDVAVHPFEPLAPAVRRGLETETQDVGRFLGARATLRLADEGGDGDESGGRGGGDGRAPARPR
jgi:hypothetical protein